MGPVLTPPALSKVFGAASVALNGSTSLTFTINNPNGAVTLTGINVSDTFPSGLVTSTPSGFTTTCGGTATITSGNVSLFGTTLAAGASCTFSLNVTANRCRPQAQRQ